MSDTTKPTISCLADQNENPNASCQFVLPYYGNNASVVDNDNCGVDSVYQNPVAGTTISANTQVWLIAQDAAGNRDSCSFMVNLNDTQLPVFNSCVNDTTLFVGAACNVAMPDLTTIPNITDNCVIDTIIQKPQAGTNINAAQTAWIIAIDEAGNSDSCSFNVSLRDTIKPTFTCIGDQNTFADASCLYSLADFTGSVGATDNCSMQSVTQNPAIGTSLGLGTTSVSVIATDTAGNVDSCTFNVIVSDTTKPTIVCPTNISTCDPLVTFNDPITSDNCSAVSLNRTDATGLNSGNTFPVGITTISFEASDLASNSSTCSFTVEVSLSESPDWTNLPDTICSSDTNINLNALITNNSNGTWSGNGVMDSTFSPVNAGSGNHDITYTTGAIGCLQDSTLTITVQNPVTSNAGMNDTTCTDNITLNAGVIFTGVWNFTSSDLDISDSTDPNATLTNLNNGTYDLVWIPTESCVLSDTVTVVFLNDPVPAYAGEDQKINSGSSVFMQADIPSNGTGTWSLLNGGGTILDINDPNTEVENLNIGTNTFEWLVDYGSCGTSSDTVNIETGDLFIPTGFSPDGDSQNDKLVIRGVGSLPNNKVIVTNRWGQELFSMENYDNSWEGVSSNGEKLIPDTYYLIVLSGNELIHKSFLEIKY